MAKTQMERRYRVREHFDDQGDLKEITMMIPKQLRSNHPNAWKHGQIPDYRLTAANALGKPLPPGVVIHHYLPSGEIVICENQRYHALLETRTRAYEATSDPHKRKCHFCKEWDLPENLICRNGREYFHHNCNCQYHKERRTGRRCISLRGWLQPLL